MVEAAARLSAMARLSRWVGRHVPTRESVEANRYLRPVAHRILAPALWRFTRRSVPRGVALGLFTGVLFPFAHMPLAAVTALPVRANVPVAVGTTLLHNPITTVPLFWAAYQLGHWVLRFDRSVPGAPIASNVKANVGLLHWLVSQGGPSTIVGLVLIAAILSVLGYVLTGLAWRIRIGRKWRKRAARKGPKQAI
ncbi:MULTISPECIES: DUF2062 domain-containing protein [Sphingomonas]|uniref:DUF2062 domain-containing protein n=1 Tax=Sphingomonas TaxID=13687 RepID=UPI002FEFEE5F